MSNYLAVATVTATIAWLLRPVTSVEPGATLTFQRPDLLEKNLAPGAVGINVYMYRATTDPYFENADLPTRWNDGGEARLPQSALDLDYLLSCYGDDTRLEPQRLFGWLEMALHAQPVLT